MNSRSLRPSESSATSTWSSAVIAEELHCRSCGYDLRGLSADGRCPECGVAIWDSVVATVDPAAAKLPSLRNPPAVGNGLLIFTFCVLAAFLLLVMPSIQQTIMVPWTLWGRRALELPTLSWIPMLALSLVGLYALWLLAPPRKREPHGAVWTDLWRMAIGYVGWLVFSMLWIEISQSRFAVRHGPEQKIVIHLAAAVFATIGLIGIRGVLRVVGQRSREYRRSKGGRQSIEIIILTVATGWLGELLGYAGALSWFPGTWRAEAQTISTMIMWVSNMLVLIGMMYLSLNAWWIRQALRKPPPAFDQVLIPKIPSDAWVRDREE